MKILVLALSFLVGATSYAQTEEFWVEKVFCGEVDPFEVGDVCILELANDGGEIALVVDYDNYMNEYGEPDADILVGNGVMVEVNTLKNPTAQFIKVLRDEMNILFDVKIYHATLDSFYFYPEN